MKKIEIKTYNSPLTLLYSVLYVIIGIILLTKPDVAATFISYGVGAILIVLAIIRFTWIYFSKKYEEKQGKWDIVLAIICLILGLGFIFFYKYIEKGLFILLGGWLIFLGINRLIYAFKNIKNSNFLPCLIISLLIIGTGIFVIAFTSLTIRWMGLIIALIGILEITGYIFNVFAIKAVEKIETPEAEYEIVKKKENS